MTKEFLRDYYCRVLEARQLRERLEVMAREMTLPRSPSLSGMPSGGGDHRQTEELALNMAELVSIYERRLSELARDGVLIEQAFDTLEPRQRMLMRARYISGLRWEEVCLVIDRSWPQTHRLHAAALKKLNE